MGLPIRRPHDDVLHVAMRIGGEPHHGSAAGHDAAARDRNPGGGVEPPEARSDRLDGDDWAAGRVLQAHERSAAEHGAIELALGRRRAGEAEAEGECKTQTGGDGGKAFHRRIPSWGTKECLISWIARLVKQEFMRFRVFLS